MVLQCQELCIHLDACEGARVTCYNTLENEVFLHSSLQESPLLNNLDMRINKRNIMFIVSSEIKIAVFVFHRSGAQGCPVDLAQNQGQWGRSSIFTHSDDPPHLPHHPFKLP